MPRKPKFRPEIRRIKLNPEQAVLACTCYQFGRRVYDGAVVTRYFPQYPGVGDSCIGRQAVGLVHDAHGKWWDEGSSVSS